MTAAAACYGDANFGGMRLNLFPRRAVCSECGKYRLWAFHQRGFYLCGEHIALVVRSNRAFWNASKKLASDYLPGFYAPERGEVA